MSKVAVICQECGKEFKIYPFRLKQGQIKYCSDCIHPLTEEARIEIQGTSLQFQILFKENPNAQVIFLELMKELKK
jgi:uncharacterized paraquat-inducible protein A